MEKQKASTKKHSTQWHANTSNTPKQFSLLTLAKTLFLVQLSPRPPNSPTSEETNNPKDALWKLAPWWDASNPSDEKRKEKDKSWIVDVSSVSPECILSAWKCFRNQGETVSSAVCSRSHIGCAVEFSSAWSCVSVKISRFRKGTKILFGTSLPSQCTFCKSAAISLPY